MICQFDITRSIEYETSLDWKLSKNQKLTFKDGRTIFNKDKSKIDKIAQDIKYLSMSEGIEWKKQKTWVVITAYKPNHRGDCANFVDSLSDAVKKAIVIDDNMFSFIVDWEISDEPKIAIRVLQEV